MSYRWMPILGKFDVTDEIITFEGHDARTTRDAQLRGVRRWNHCLRSGCAQWSCVRDRGIRGGRALRLSAHPWPRSEIGRDDSRGHIRCHAVHVHERSQVIIAEITPSNPN